MKRPAKADVGAAVAILAAALVYVTGVLVRNARLGVGVPSFDTHEADYPNIVYTLRALHEGHGLLWNRLQNCGQPFLASTLAGLLYPLHWLVLACGPDAGLPLIAGVHLAIAGLGTYALCRALGMGEVAALTGALCLELGGTANELAGWLPFSVLGAYAWTPVVLWRCERLLRAPTTATGVALALALTMQLLPGYPQSVLFSYQIVALRVVWECVTDRGLARGRVLAATALALLLPAALGAVQLLPMAEFARVSIRNRALDPAELGFGDWSWAVFRHAVAWRMGAGNYLAVVPMALAAAALLRWPRRMSLFYLGLAVLYAALAFDNPLLRLYLRLPLGSAFRGIGRTLAVTQLAISVAAALGTDAIVGAPGSGGRRLAPLALLIGAAGFCLLSSTGLDAREWGALVALLGASAWLSWRLPGGVLARVAVPVVVALSLLAHGAPFLRLVGDPSVFTARQRTFDVVRARMTPQERMCQESPQTDFSRTDFSMMPKSASVFGIPSILDYEPQTSQRYADLLLALTRSRGRSINHVVDAAHHPPATRPLLDLMAVRYVVIKPSGAEPFSLLGPDARLRDPAVDADVQVYENRTALPRAFYVPGIRVQSAATVVPTLSMRYVDPRQWAVVEAAPADGFLGGGEAGGTADIVADRSEEVVVRVEAPHDGFLFLADQDYPGWQVTVNDVPVPILRANYAFRLVRVPAGASTVTFRYRPASVWWGAALSGASLGLLLVWAGTRALRRG